MITKPYGPWVLPLPLFKAIYRVSHIVFNRFGLYWDWYSRVYSYQKISGVPFFSSNDMIKNDVN